MKKEITIVCVSYKRYELAPVLIHCFLAQTLQNFRLLMLHDGPDEKMEAIFSEFKSRNPEVFDYYFSTERYNDYGHSLRDIGIKISLDDFGTGYSSLSYVHALRLDKIKIDRSFIRDIQSNSASMNIVRSVIALCRDMDLSCVIEGVESNAQLDIVKQLGGTVIQGFYFSKPMPAHELTGYLQNEKSLNRKPIEV